LIVSFRPIYEVILDFARWYAKGDFTCVWAQGATFDPILWEAACTAVGDPVPWKFFNVRDTRTLYDLASFDHRSVKREGIAHHALDDCRHQIECCRRAHQLLLGGRSTVEKMGAP